MADPATPPVPNSNPAPPPSPGSSMPEGLPTQFWDSQSNQVNIPEFVKSYGEVSAFKTQHDQRMASLPKRPEDYKIELKLPDTVKVPDGLELKIDDKDPRLGMLREFAVKNQMAPELVNEIVALEAQMQIAAHVQGEAHLQAEMKKLGENGKARVGALEDFLKANVSKEEYAALRPVIGDAAAFSAIEKLIAKAVTQRVPGNLPTDPPKPAPKSMEDRWYNNGSQPRAN